MSHLCWVFVLLVVFVVVGASSDDISAHECEQKWRSLANLELAEDALKKAKQLYSNCGKENENSNCSECSKKNQFLEFIGVALNMVSNARQNVPICTQVPTQEPTPENITQGRGLPKDCQDLQASGKVKTGVYTVWPQGGKPVRVRCDMDTDGGGWTVIQRRGNFTKQENFFRNWKAYKTGFGNLNKDFWLGNDKIFALTNQGAYSLRIDMTAANGDSAHDVYREFRIEDENANYKLHLKHDGRTEIHTGTLFRNSGMMFTTKDRDNDVRYKGNCAHLLKGGFWYDNCSYGNPNGLYQPGVDDETSMFHTGFPGRAVYYPLK